MRHVRCETCDASAIRPCSQYRRSERRQRHVMGLVMLVVSAGLLVLLGAVR